VFSQTTEYALRAVVWLADHPSEPQTAREIAEGMSVPQMYLSKVMQLLVRAGVVRGQRGKSGGFVLAKPVDELSVWEVVNAVEPLRRIRTCPLGLARHRHLLCPLHRKMDQTLASIEDDFKSTFISDLVEAPATIPELIGVAHAK
jgi:Rrf2 family transcriptional regulator, nitric oxide-sensitive transcriptional repressor